MPVGNIEHSAQAGGAGSADSYRLDYWFAMHDMLSEGAELWGKLEPELRAGPALLSVRQLVDEAMAKLREIDTGVFRIEYPTLERAAKRILSTIQAAKGPGIMPQVGYIEGDEQNATFTFEDVPLTVMAAAGFVRLDLPTSRPAR